MEQWWARRQFSRGVAVPYPVGTYRDAWASFPALIRQYHPDLNHGFTLTQIPPAAEVLLVWQCEAGHEFVATPSEQRERPGGQRRRSAWCPVCAQLAVGRPRPRLASAPGVAPRRTRPARALCPKTPDVRVGTAFASECAPKPASAAEADLRAGLAERLQFTAGMNAVRVARPFFDHREVWPDILLPELLVAIEYDTTGRHGLEHVGPRQRADERKDRALRAASWEVVRIRTGKLPALGPHDLVVSGVTRRTYALLLDELRAIRGALFVDAYLR